MTGSDKILIIDDDPKMRELLFECLAPLGYDVTQADSGQRALELINEIADPTGTFYRFSMGSAMLKGSK